MADVHGAVMVPITIGFIASLVGLFVMGGLLGGITGSFLTPAYADAWLEHIKGFGYDARIVDMNGGKWQLVSARSFPDLHGAWNALGSIQDNINSEAWVYRKQ